MARVIADVEFGRRYEVSPAIHLISCDNRSSLPENFVEYGFSNFDILLGWPGGD